SLGLQINTQKTEIFVQPIVPPIEAPQFYINGDPIKIVNQFKYLGSTLTPTCSLDMEIQTRVNLASVAFGRLRTRVFLNNDREYGTKTAVYLAKPGCPTGAISKCWKTSTLDALSVPLEYPGKIELPKTALMSPRCSCQSEKYMKMLSKLKETLAKPTRMRRISLMYVAQAVTSPN
ncbi:hypothetical protein Hamer_G027620, partial [Homarus americanus]